MSVTSHDLKSMLSKVRRADPAPAPAPPPAVPPAAEPPAAAAAPPDTDTAAAEAIGEESTDVNSILEEIYKDEDLMTRILGILYRARKKSPNGGAVAIMPMERELGIARESATFVLNYMKTKHFIEADDKSRNVITVEGIDFLRARLIKA